MTPAEIAAKLTPARKETIKAAGRGIFKTVDDYKPAIWLAEAGLINRRSQSFGATRWEITPLGRAVLAELEGK